MKLYYSKGACSLAVRIVIHELQIPCEFESVDLKAKKTQSGQDFLTINPKGAVPTLVLDSKDTLTENAAIQQYLADTYSGVKLLPKVGDIARYHVLEWLNFVGTDLHKNFSPLFNPKLPEDAKEKLFIPLIRHKLDFVETNLKNKQYLMGEDFTLPDGYLFVILRWLKPFNISISDWPNLSNYFKLLQERPSIQQSLKEENL